jgi:hypothetical protein
MEKVLKIVGLEGQLLFLLLQTLYLGSLVSDFSQEITSFLI